LEELLADREFAYRDQDFRRVKHLIGALAGIALSEGKREFVYSRLARLVRARRLRSIQAYLDLVESDGSEVDGFINALTTNLTSFFREAHHFSALREFALARKADEIRVWSAACSTGEEAYSIAIVLAELSGLRVSIVASDVDTTCLSRAASGVYPAASVASLPGEIVRRSFLQGARERRGFVRVRKALRESIQFRRLNLIDSAWNVGTCSVIFCRNVFIYFDRATQQRIVEQLWDTLEPGGLLMTGHAENLSYAQGFERVGTTIYRKRDR